jgi:hypothetical protein
MTPLDIRLDHGLEDDRLLYHIGVLNGLGLLSPGEFDTLNLLWERLDYITTPTLTDTFRHRSRT